MTLPPHQNKLHKSWTTVCCLFKKYLQMKRGPLKAAWHLQNGSFFGSGTHGIYVILKICSGPRPVLQQRAVNMQRNSSTKWSYSMNAVSVHLNWIIRFCDIGQNKKVWFLAWAGELNWVGCAIIYTKSFTRINQIISLCPSKNVFFKSR